MHEQIGNSLDFLMQNNQTYLENPMKVSLWALSEAFLGHLDNKAQIIDYFNSKQESDGGWADMFTTHRVLLVYHILNATPAHSLDAFFSNYDTWDEALSYDLLYHGTFYGSSIYHILFGWCLYYWTYPSWLSDYFSEVEKDLSWTNGTDFHKRTHILYSYVITRRPFPNLDGIINTTLAEQMPDGHWEMWWDPQPRPVYSTAIQLSLLTQILKLYPGYRTGEITESVERTAAWVNSSYRTQVLDGKVCGYFGEIINIEDAVFSGILCAGQDGLLDANVDMTFQDVVNLIVPEIPNAILFISLFTFLPVIAYKRKKRLQRQRCSILPIPKKNRR
jgi:hypothetical protein